MRVRTSTTGPHASPEGISDVGMTGSRESVLGVKWEQALKGFRTQMPQRFETAEEDLWVNAVVVDVGRDGLAERIEQVLEPMPME